jgi:hypothetical protein
MDMPHSNQPRANPPPTRPRVTPVRVVRTRKRTRSANIARDSVEMALVYLAESIYHHGNIAPPPLPQGVHALSDLTGRNLALYVLGATHDISRAQRSRRDIRLESDDVAYFNVFRASVDESNESVFRRIMQEHRFFMSATHRVLAMGGGHPPQWGANLCDLETNERFAAQQNFGTLQFNSGI